MAPTTTIERVTVIRPLKIMAFICGCLSLLLLLISVASTYWLESKDYRQGLWQECNRVDGDMVCTDNESTDWIIACAALVVIAMISDLAAIILNGAGLIMKSSKNKFMCYRIAMYIFFFAMICLIIALIVFPAMFMQEIDDREEGDNTWYFGWSYGVAWGAAIFLLGAAILLLVDKESDEIYYREKTYYHNEAGTS